MDKTTIKESTILRGICASIQNMVLPKFENLINLFRENGYELTIKKKS